MPRYFFHIRDHGVIELDDEGTDLPDLDAAHFEAMSSAKEQVANGLLEGKPLGFAADRRFEVTDVTGRTVLTVPFMTAANADDYRP